jgi:WD40 repeat protein
MRLFTSVAFSPDGTALATCTTSGTATFGDRRVKLWDSRSGRLLREFERPQSRGRFVAISPDGTILACSGQGKAIALWDLRTGQLLRELVGHPHPPQSAAFSADGRILVSGADYRTVKVWEVASGRLLATLVTFTYDRSAPAAEDWLAFSPENEYAGSPAVDRFLAWRVDGAFWTADRLAPRLHRPDRIESVLRPQR